MKGSVPFGSVLLLGRLSKREKYGFAKHTTYLGRTDPRVIGRNTRTFRKREKCGFAKTNDLSWTNRSSVRAYHLQKGNMTQQCANFKT